MKTESTMERRKFLKGAALASGLAALLGMIKPASARSPKPAPQSDGTGQGYRLTEHVKRYYETARL